MNNQQVAHNFAYGENANGSNFYSKDNGTLLYSYSSLMARRFDSLILVDDNIATYSSSSQKHHSHFYKACKHIEIIYVSELDRYGKLEDFLNQRELNIVNTQLVELYKKQKRARTRDYSYEILEQKKKGDCIIKYGDIDKRSIAYKTFLDFKNGTDIEDLITKAIKAEKHQNNLIAKRNFEDSKRRYENFTEVKCPYEKPTDLNYNWLKIDGDELKTNSSITVPLEDAYKLYKAYKDGLDVVGQKIGVYTILDTNDKVVTIGCHKLLVKELDRVLG